MQLCDTLDTNTPSAERHEQMTPINPELVANNPVRLFSCSAVANQDGRHLANTKRPGWQPELVGQALQVDLQHDKYMLLDGGDDVHQQRVESTIMSGRY